jgi:hypothetical protein
MRKRRRADPRRTDPAREGERWKPSLGFLAIAVGVVLGGAVAWWWMSDSASAGGVTAQVASVPVKASAPALVAEPPPVLAAANGSAPAMRLAAAPAPTPRIARTRDPNGDQTPDIADYINEGERPTMNEVIARLRDAGVQGGLAAFSPPGTRPPLVGLAVPEDFPLPDGYVRHHQATDDGQRIEAILMFTPDRQFVDAAGRPIAIPENRVVPPELAPPGLPVRRITIPAPADAGTAPR